MGCGRSDRRARPGSDAGAGGVEAGVGATQSADRLGVMLVAQRLLGPLLGGAGSLDELFEVLTWRQLGLHDKPIFLLSIDGYWQPLEALLDHVIAEGFADALDIGGAI